MYKTISFRENTYCRQSDGTVKKGCLTIDFRPVTERELRGISKIFKKDYRQKVGENICHFLKCKKSSKALFIDDIRIFIAKNHFDLDFIFYVYCSLYRIHKLLEVLADETLKTEITREVFEHV